MATKTPENNDLIGWLAKNNRAARAARTEVDCFDVARRKEQRETYTSKLFIPYISFNSVPTSPFLATFDNKTKCGQEGIIAK